MCSKRAFHVQSQNTNQYLYCVYCYIIKLKYCLFIYLLFVCTSFSCEDHEVEGQGKVQGSLLPLPLHTGGDGQGEGRQTEAVPTTRCGDTHCRIHAHTHTHKAKAKQSVLLPLSGHAIWHSQNARALSGPMSQCNATSWSRARNSQVD